MNIRFSFFALALVLVGCAHTPPQQALPLNSAVFTTSTNKIGVAMSALPKVDTQFPGASCLLCIGAASLANSSLTDYTRTLPSDDLAQLKQQAVEILRKKGANVSAIPANLDIAALPDFGAPGPDIAKKDFSSFKAKYQIDSLLVIDFRVVGIQRPYAAYVPISDPQAYILGSAYIVNLDNNHLEWYEPLAITKASDNVWDEPPQFPGLTNAYFQALEIAKDSILNPLSRTNAQRGGQVVAKSAPAVTVPPIKPTAQPNATVTPIEPASPKAKEMPTLEPTVAAYKAAESSAPVVVAAPVVEPKAAEIVVAPITPVVYTSAAPAVVMPVQQTIEPRIPVNVEQPVSQAATAPKTNVYVQEIAPSRNDAMPIVTANVEFKLGESSNTVERMAKNNRCESTLGAGLFAKSGPVEKYRVTCLDGRTLVAKCEFRQCEFDSQN
jgi:hypothetical protein